ncbi:hypothetical protein [Mycobacterium avium]|uniref:hypothetical protein n=1 Tax=Mycobacterium avium TaxID=1764 RepID=UPI001CC552A7|nr:hypothetical protein [Mycobacterium avium]MBZ4521836.1 hypothetical protein [Mycobacterium avium subsp. hominissuis]MBZ4531152.1 hypothetical protein [Mycobacterium avium subsp. hominissuis]
MDIEVPVNELGSHLEQVGDVRGRVERIPGLRGDAADGSVIDDAKLPDDACYQIVSLIGFDASQNKRACNDVVRQNRIENGGVSAKQDDFATLWIGRVRGQLAREFNSQRWRHL